MTADSLGNQEEKDVAASGAEGEAGSESLSRLIAAPSEGDVLTATVVSAGLTTDPLAGDAPMVDTHADPDAISVTETGEGMTCSETRAPGIVDEETELIAASISSLGDVSATDAVSEFPAEPATGAAPVAEVVAEVVAADVAVADVLVAAAPPVAAGPAPAPVSEWSGQPSHDAPPPASPAAEAEAAGFEPIDDHEFDANHPHDSHGHEGMVDAAAFGHSLGSASAPSNAAARIDVAADDGMEGFIRYILIAWASVATAVAFWLWWNRAPGSLPLENLPDDGDLRGAVVSPVETLYASQMIPLGETRRVGNLEVTPLRIEVGRAEQVDKDHPDMSFPISPVLVMHLKLKNVSQDQTFSPTDPVFFYFPDPIRRLRNLKVFDKTGYTYSYIQAKGDPLDLVLPYDLTYRQGMQLVGQEHRSLAPGEEMETIVISAENGHQDLSAENVWRVKLRKGRRRSGKGVATVVGIPFRRQDVANWPTASG